MNCFANVVATLNNFFWGTPMLILLIGVGVFLSIKTGFVQFLHFPDALQHIRLSLSRSKRKKHSVSSFQSFATALGATIGIGNIVGVAGAITLGGPGAIFWMWVAGFVGMATKYSEIVLAIRYREHRCNGTKVGGPMYYIKNGLGKQFAPLALLFSVFGCLAVFGTGNMTQVNAAAETISAVAVRFSPTMSENELLIKLAVGAVFAVLIGITMPGGAKSVGTIAERLVPFMAVLYLLCAACVILFNLNNLIPTISLIVTSAFRPMSAVGGAAGITMMHCLRLGIGRGIFSNEAGLGTSPIAYASSDSKSAVEQGLLGIMEVFVDTIVICTVTALVILMSGVFVPYGDAVGINLTIGGLETVFGTEVTSIVMAVMISLFAYSSMLAWSVYGVRCFETLFGGRAVKAYRVAYLLFTILGAVLQLRIVWDISSLFNGLMAIPNLLALALLSGEVRRLTKEYFGTNKNQKRIRFEH